MEEGTNLAATVQGLIDGNMDQMTSVILAVGGGMITVALLSFGIYKVVGMFRRG